MNEPAETDDFDLVHANEVLEHLRWSLVHALRAVEEGKGDTIWKLERVILHMVTASDESLLEPMRATVDFCDERRKEGALSLRELAMLEPDVPADLVEPRAVFIPDWLDDEDFAVFDSAETRESHVLRWAMIWWLLQTLAEVKAREDALSDGIERLSGARDVVCCYAYLCEAFVVGQMLASGHVPRLPCHQHVVEELLVQSREARLEPDDDGPTTETGSQP